MRYIGTSPNNYIYFNCSNTTSQSDSTCEKWRIIGIFNSNSHGMNEELIKITREQTSAQAWDTNNKNDWTNSTLKNYLNGTYYTNLNSSAKQLIQPVVWKIGGVSSSNTGEDWIPNVMYSQERGTIGSYTAPATYTWSDPGYVALLYITDYLYATSGGNFQRSECLATSVINSSKWRNSDDDSCRKSSWLILRNQANIEWTLTPDRTNPAGVYYRYPPKDNNRYLLSRSDGSGSRSTFTHTPTVYLKSSVICTNCNEADAGSSDNPFELSYTAS